MCWVLQVDTFEFLILFLLHFISHFLWFHCIYHCVEITNPAALHSADADRTASYVLTLFRNLAFHAYEVIFYDSLVMHFTSFSFMLYCSLTKGSESIRDWMFHHLCSSFFPRTVTLFQYINVMTFTITLVPSPSKGTKRTAKTERIWL